jgi:hypothetical protein
MWQRKACARDPEGLRRRRLESRVLHYRSVAMAREGEWGSYGRSIQLEPPPAHDHRLILIPRQAEQHASAAAWKERLTDLPIFADCSTVLRRPMNFQIWSNQIRGARACRKSLYSANSILIVDLSELTLFMA